MVSATVGPMQDNLAAARQQDPFPAPQNRRSPSPASKGALAILVASGLLLYGYRLGAKDFWSPPEGRTAIVARAMLSSGDWLLPHIAGQVYVQKPPLYHWLVACSFWLTGVQSEATARIPSGLAALVTLFLVYQLGCRLGGERVGRTAAIGTGMSVLFAWHGINLAPDPRLR